MKLNYDTIRKAFSLATCLAIAVTVVCIGNNYWPPRGSVFVVPLMCLATSLFVFFTGVAIALKEPEPEFN